MPTDEKGLTTSEAQEQLVKYGPNKLPEKPPPSDLYLFIYQFKNPFVYVLLAAGVTTTIIGHISDSIIILFAVVINTILGFIQERRASHALEALKKMVHPQTRVIRDGKEQTIAIEEVVPGDVVVLDQGEKIPADGTVIEANRLFIDEAILTGESIPVEKEVDSKVKHKSLVAMGTIVTAGKGMMRVTTTGENTQMGKIATSIQEPGEDTPLRKQLKTLSKQLSILVFSLTGLVFVIGLLTGRGTLEMFTTAVALSVSAIPEGLLVALTVVLAIGMQRILGQKGLVRNLVSAETLGGVTIICVDKTGTLTQGSMKVADFIGDKKALARQAVLANDMDDPIVIAAYEWARKVIKNHQSLVKSHHRIDSLPFSSKDRFFASLNKNEKGSTLYVNGAPEILLDWTTLDKSAKKKIMAQIDQLTSEGKRLLGMAKKPLSSTDQKLTQTDVKTDLDWVGILAFNDPIRPDVRGAFERTRLAGVGFLVITGDYPETAISIMGQLGIKVSADQVVTGKQLSTMSVQKLSTALSHEKIKLFARTTPDQKLKIVESLKKNGEVVAMMGDGVNDAPALKKSDIGIVVGEASDVAKETADLILLDSSFATIVEAIEEGRGIFDNIRKIILYLMSDAFEEIIAVLGTMILGFPLPIMAGQVLWINIISDGFPDLALTMDPKAPGIMKRPPRSPKENLVAPWMRWIIMIVSLVGGLVALAVFIYFHAKTGDYTLSRSIAFGVLGLNSLVYVFSIRTLSEPFWRENPFNNKWLNLAVLGGLAFQVLPFCFEQSRKFLRLEVLSPIHWLVIVGSSVMMFMIVEVLKDTLSHKLK